MAKQVLDLYELYRLVVARGGLVEVINKKIWREITKGLNLPSSITSAAFTLRTQYMKYLYPYECEKERLSTPEELQQAIDGNRREGRRSSYGHYGDMMGATPPPASTGLSRNHTPSHHNSPISLVSRHVNGHSSQGVSSGEEDNASVNSSTNTPFPTQEQALNLEVKSSSNNNGSGRDTAHIMREAAELSARVAMEAASRKMHEDSLGVPPSKRIMSDEMGYLINAGLPNAHIKIASR
ncbi:protein dead ringer-like protein, partial [Dinothrombium tinctorium]